MSWYALQSDEFRPQELLADTFLQRVEHLAETGSTNDVALRLATELPCATPLLVIADRQTAGRGRGANRWWSSEGALTFSLILSTTSIAIEPENWPQISLATAVALCDTLEQIVPTVPFSIKWPNDVFAGDRKISGMLIEVPGNTSQNARNLVLGVGLNLNNSWRSAPSEIELVGTSLCDLTESSFDRTAVLKHLLGALQMRLGQLSQRDPRLCDAWRMLSYLTGRSVTVDLTSRKVSGLCEGIDDQGRLSLAVAGKREYLSAGVIESYS